MSKSVTTPALVAVASIGVGNLLGDDYSAQNTIRAIGSMGIAYAALGILSNFAPDLALALAWVIAGTASTTQVLPLISKYYGE